MDQEAQAAAIEALYQEIFEHYRGRDADLVPRQLIPEALASRVLLLGQALAEKTQRLSGIPYCLSPPDSSRLSKGGRALDAFLSNFGYTIDPSNAERQYAYHTDLAHYFPGKKRKGEFGDIRPSASDVDHDRDWFEREVRILRPRVIVALGKDPAIAFAGRYLCLRVKNLSDLPIDPAETRVAGVDVSFLAVHHPSGAFQHPPSVERYAQAGRHIREILSTGWEIGTK